MKRAWLLTFLFFAAAAGAQKVNPHSQISWPAACNAPGMVYNIATNTCTDISHIPPAQVTWPPSCTTGVYSPAGNTCVPTGTAANPGGTTGQMQYNAGGVFGGIPGSAVDGSGNVTLPGIVAAYTPHWTARVQAVKTGGSPVNARVCGIGPSTLYGTHVDPLDLNDPLYSSLGQAAADFNLLYGIPATWDSFFGDGSASTESFGISDSRLVKGASFAMSFNRVSLGNATFQATTSTAPMAFSPILRLGTPSPVDTFRIFYVVDAGLGSFTANIDGGTATVQSTAGTASVGTLTLSAGSVGTHTLNISQTSGQVNIIGVDAYDSTSSHVIFELGGSPSEHSGNATDTTKPYGGGNTNIYAAIGCDLTVIDTSLGENDVSFGRTVAQFTTAIQTLITVAHAAGSDVVLLSPMRLNPASFPIATAQTPIYNAAKALAAANTNPGTNGAGLPFIDDYTQYVSYPYALAQGYYASDNLHPSTSGASIVAVGLETAMAARPGQSMSLPPPVTPPVGQNGVFVTGGGGHYQPSAMELIYGGNAGYIIVTGPDPTTMPASWNLWLAHSDGSGHVVPISATPTSVSVSGLFSATQSISAAQSIWTTGSTTLPASSIGMSFAASTGFTAVSGPNATTYAPWNLYLQHSDGSAPIQPLTVSTTQMAASVPFSSTGTISSSGGGIFVAGNATGPASSVGLKIFSTAAYNVMYGPSSSTYLNALNFTFLHSDGSGTVTPLVLTPTALTASVPFSASSLAVAGARKGTFVCTAGGTITIANANEAVTSDVIISLNTAGGTITTPPAMKTVTAATGFSVLCGATDTSVYNYSILN